MPLPQLERRVLPFMGGADYLGPELNGSTYRFKFMQNGRVIWVDVDGQGRVLALEILTNTPAVVWATVTTQIPFAIAASVTAPCTRVVMSMVSVVRPVSTLSVRCTAVTRRQPRCAPR